MHVDGQEDFKQIDLVSILFLNFFKSYLITFNLHIYIGFLKLNSG